jgi:hypothetical protein
MAQRARRLLAIRHLGRAVAAYYGLDETAVLADAARFAGASALSDIPAGLQKPAVDYLCGRLLLPDSGAPGEL